MQWLIRNLFIILIFSSIRAIPNPMNQFFHLLGKNPPPNGYFVLTASSFTPDFGGVAGANNLCLSELQNNNWKGKGQIAFDSSTVKAFLCDSTGCQNPWPGIYKAALAGVVSVGGGTITVDAAGLGPYDDIDWRNSLYFGTTTLQFWSGRDKFSQTDYRQLFEDNKWPDLSSSNTCSDWSTTLGNGILGQNYAYSTTWASDRWNYSSVACTSSGKLLCVVKPSSSWDSTPDVPSFSNVTNAEKSTQYTASSQILGIKTPVYAIVTNMDPFAPGTWAAEIRNVTLASSWTNKVLVNPGDTLEVRSNSFPTLTGTKQVILSIGTLSHIWTIETRAPNPEVNYGFLVSTDLTYDGNLGGLAGANAKCLAETSNRWANQGRVKVTAANVKAFLCDSSVCQNLLPNKKYYFDRFGFGAGSSNIPLSGGFIYSDGGGLGPNTRGLWSSGVFAWFNPWTGRGSGNPNLWANTNSGSHCNNWTNNTNSLSGTTSDTTGTASTRWNTGTPETCDNYNTIICLIHPPSDGFGFDDVLLAMANTLYSKSFTFTALTSPISANVVNGDAEIRKNAGSWGTSISTLSNGDTIEVRMTSSILKNGAKLAKIQAGDAEIDWMIRNKDPVNDEQKFSVPFGLSYGWHMAISGNTLVLANNTSTLQIYTNSGGIWSLSETKTISFTPTSIAIDGNIIALGNENYSGMYDNGGPFSGGRVVVLEKGANWASGTMTDLLPAVGVANGKVGRAVGVKANLILASAETSEVYFFENTGAGWAAASKNALTSGSIVQSATGSNISIKGNTAVVGSYQVNQPGMVNVFENTGGGWATATRTSWSASDSVINDYFGYSLDLSSDGNTIVVGANGNNASRTLNGPIISGGHGRAYVYEKGANWASRTETKLFPPNNQPYAAMGSAAKIEGDLIAISAESGLAEGVVYLFKKNLTWSSPKVDILMKRTDGTDLSGPYDNFGRDMTMDSSSIVTINPNSPLGTQLNFYNISALTGM